MNAVKKFKSTHKNVAKVKKLSELLEFDFSHFCYFLSIKDYLLFLHDFNSHDSIGFNPIKFNSNEKNSLQFNQGRNFSTENCKGIFRYKCRKLSRD